MNSYEELCSKDDPSELDLAVVFWGEDSNEDGGEKAAEELSTLRAENAKLKDELSERDEYYKRVVSEKCAGDEQHCACVPALRAELARLKAVEEAAKVFILAWNKSDPGDLLDGITTINALEHMERLVNEPPSAAEGKP